MHAHTYVFTHTSYLHLRAADTFSRPTALRLIRNKPGKIHTFNSLSLTSQSGSHFPDKEKRIWHVCGLHTFIREQYRFIGICGLKSEKEKMSRLDTRNANLEVNDAWNIGRKWRSRNIPFRMLISWDSFAFIFARYADGKYRKFPRGI